MRLVVTYTPDVSIDISLPSVDLGAAVKVTRDMTLANTVFSNVIREIALSIEPHITEIAIVHALVVVK